VLRRIFGPKRGEVTGNGEVCIARSCRWLVGKPQGKRPLGRPKHTWDENMKTDLGELNGLIDVA
jgi:hypothetical protein